MTVYNQHIFTAIFVGQTGHQHVRNASATDEAPTAIECVSCEPFLVKEGWTHSPEQVPLTDRQVTERDRTEREGNMAVKQVAEALATTAAAALASGAAARARREKKPFNPVG